MKLLRNVQLAAWLAPCAAAAMAVTMACSPDSTPETTTPVSIAAANAVPALTAAQQARLAAARASTRWVGDAHHAGMQVVIASIKQHRAAKRRLPAKGSAEYCAIMEKVGDAALEVLDRHRNVTRATAERLARVRQENELTRCFSPLAIFGSPAAPAFAHATAMQEYDPEVTGAYEQYLDPMDYAVRSTDGSVRAVRSALEGVLAQAVAGGIPEGDLLALTSFAGLVESSAVEWNAFDWSGISGGGGSDGGGDYQMSVFALTHWDDRPLKVIGADAVGCFSTVKGWGALKALLIGPAWAALAAECGVRGAIASGAAIIGML